MFRDDISKEEYEQLMAKAEQELRDRAAANPRNVFYQLAVQSFESSAHLSPKTVFKRFDANTHALARIEFFIRISQDFDVGTTDMLKTLTESAWLNHSLDSIQAGIRHIRVFPKREVAPAVYGFITGMLAGYSLGRHDGNAAVNESALATVLRMQEGKFNSRLRKLQFYRRIWGEYHEKCRSRDMADELAAQDPRINCSKRQMQRNRQQWTTHGDLIDGLVDSSK